MFIVDSRRPHAKNAVWLLQRSYRAEGTTKHETVANLSHCSQGEIDALKLAIKHKDDLTDLGSLSHDVEVHQGKSVGALLLLWTLATRIGLVKALGASRQGLLALWQVFARILAQGSRLSAVREAGAHEAATVLGLKEGFDEEDLYANLDWLEDHQEHIEKKLFQERFPGTPPSLFLYDVTSSYLEGTENELGEYGYNRDKKKGKEQIVVGLLCDPEGRPVSIEAFPGNTQDLKTFYSQVTKVSEQFGCSEVTFVGDRGMIKTPQQEDLAEAGFSFITALTLPQVKGLLADGTLQMSLFDGKIQEVEAEGKRYVVRRNPVRADEIAATRKAKQAKIQALVDTQTAYLKEHAKAKSGTAVKKIQARITQLAVSGWLKVEEKERILSLVVDEAALKEEAQLDGCYVLITDLPKAQASAETVHARYKDLAEVEQAFRTMKTGHLEIRPIYVRTEAHTRGHVLVAMLAYLLRQELAQAWEKQNLTVEEGLARLSRICLQEIRVKGRPGFFVIPKPTPEVQALLDALKVTLPKTLTPSPVIVDSTRKLPERRNLPKPLVKPGKAA
jgi:transposase